MEFCAKFPLVRAILAIFAFGYPVFVAIATKSWHFSQKKPIVVRTSGNLAQNPALKSILLHFHQF